jgi:hypothetical protein
MFQPAKKFHLNASRMKHLARHFFKSELAGSTFNLSTFASPEDLVDFINSHSYEDSNRQTHSKSIFCFTFKHEKFVGLEGISLRSSLTEHSIVREKRDGHTIDVAVVNELKKTQFFCVIAKEQAEHFSIITAFPGNYARPFAQKGQPADDYAMNKKFWEEHVLLKRINI